MDSHYNQVMESANEALEVIKNRAAKEYAKLEADPVSKQKIFAAAAASADEIVRLSKKYPRVKKGEDPEQQSKMIVKYMESMKITQSFSEDEIKLLQDGILFPTFKMKVLKGDANQHWVDITRDGKRYLYSVTSDDDIDWAKVEQYASILIEAVLLILSAIGIKLSPSAKVIEKTVDETADAIRNSSQMRRALDTFVKSWNAAGSNAVDMAAALFTLIKESYAAGILWTIIESLCSNMAWYDWLETAARITAMLIASFATGGAALIAKIALVVLSAVDFAVKIVNIGDLNSIKIA